jgi:hypothetical protein
MSDISIEEARRRSGNGQPGKLFPLAGPRRRITLVPFDAVTLDTTGSYIVKGLVPDAGLSVIWGPPKCGKSFLASDIAFHVALGWPWRDRKVKAGPVVYLAAEGAHGFKARIAAFRQERLGEEVAPVPFYLVPCTLDLIGEHVELIGAIRETLGDHPLNSEDDQKGAENRHSITAMSPVLVVIDTLNRTLRGSENSDEDMSDYIKAADAIREAFGCAVVIVHHCGVEGTRPRGHTSLSGAVDCQIAVRKANGVVTATVELMKDGQEGDAFGSLLKVVEVGTDDDGDPITSCVIEPTDAVSAQSASNLTARQQRGLDVLHDLMVDAGKPSPGGAHYPANAVVVPVELWRDYLFKAGVLDKDAPNPRQPFKRLRESLIQRGVIREWDGLIWTSHDFGA